MTCSGHWSRFLLVETAVRHSDRVEKPQSYPLVCRKVRQTHLLLCFLWVRAQHRESQSNGESEVKDEPCVLADVCYMKHTLDLSYKHTHTDSPRVKPDDQLRIVSSSKNLLAHLIPWTLGGGGGGGRENSFVRLIQTQQTHSSQQNTTKYLFSSEDFLKIVSSSVLGQKIKNQRKWNVRELAVCFIQGCHSWCVNHLN